MKHKLKLILGLIINSFSLTMNQNNQFNKVSQEKNKINELTKVITDNQEKVLNLIEKQQQEIDNLKNTIKILINDIVILTNAVNSNGNAITEHDDIINKNDDTITYNATLINDLNKNFNENFTKLSLFINNKIVPQTQDNVKNIHQIEEKIIRLQHFIVCIFILMISGFSMLFSSNDRIYMRNILCFGVVIGVMLRDPQVANAVNRFLNRFNNQIIYY
jgi:hypothetical protein